MKLPKLITRRRVKWTGLAATLLLAAAMVASIWYWPSYYWDGMSTQKNPSVHVHQGAILFELNWRTPDYSSETHHHWDLFSRQAFRTWMLGEPQEFRFDPRLIIWLPQFDLTSNQSSADRSVLIPLWIPLVLMAIPTGILFFRDSRPKPGCCTKCRYDLSRLSGETCPECGTKIATTDSRNAPASTAEGENGVGVEGNGVS